LHTGSIPVVAFVGLLQPRARAADARRMSGPNTDRTETRKIVRRGERTIDVRLITYPAGKRKR
jgi:hypothetical protein